MKIQSISSSSNQRFKNWLTLHEAKGIRKQGRFLLFGEKVISELLQSHPQRLCELFFSTKGKSQFEQWHQGWPEPARSQPVDFFCLDEPLFRQLDLFGTHQPIAVVAAAETPQWDHSSTHSGLTLLCPLGDPSNLGALIRTASALDVTQFVLLQEAACPWHPKSVRAASGSIFSLRFLQGPSIHELADLSLDQCLALDGAGSPIQDFKWPESPLLLIGEEGPGVPQNFNGQKLGIPLHNGVESLNATVAAAIALAHYRFQCS